MDFVTYLLSSGHIEVFRHTPSGSAEKPQFRVLKDFSISDSKESHNASIGDFITVNFDKHSDFHIIFKCKNKYFYLLNEKRMFISTDFNNEIEVNGYSYN